MSNKEIKFLKQLVEAPSPSGYEQPAAKVLCDYLSDVADDVSVNVLGSVHAVLNGSDDAAPSVMLAGHIDEIGMMVRYVSPEGFISFGAIGGVDAAILPGMRVDVHTSTGVLRGVMGRKPIHLIEEKERTNVTKIDKLFIDLGLPVDEVKAKVRIGDPITFAVGFEEFGKGLVVSRGLDDKMGAWICARVLSEVRAQGGSKATLLVAGTVQEEIGLRGGETSAYALDPTVGIAVEVCHATDYPGIDKTSYGEIIVGGGPVIARGPNINHELFDRLTKAADSAEVAYQIGAEPRGTGTDANAIQLSRGGKVAGLVSIPLRYMHTPTEVLAISDLEACIKLLTRFMLDLDATVDFTPTM